MAESYSGDGGGTIDGDLRLARELLALLVRGGDVDLLSAALMAERSATPLDARDAAARELARVRALLALGESARALQHAFSNPLTALLAEAQMLESEPLTPDQHAAVGRVTELARRLVALTRELDLPGARRVG